MTYSAHLQMVIAELKQARPELSQQQIAREGGLGRDWVGRMQSDPKTTLANAEKFIALARRLCPVDERGNRLRQLIDALDRAAEQTQGDAA